MRNQVMRTGTELLTLLPNHAEDLHRSGLSDETIKRWRCYSITADQPWVMGQLGFGHVEAPVLALPILPPGRMEPNLNEIVIKPDHPRRDGKGRPIKYETRPRSQNRIHLPLRCQEAINDPVVTLWITEGLKKAEKAAQEGLCCIALHGVWNWLSRISSDLSSPLADFDLIEIRGREVNIVFDSDIATNPSVRMAGRRLAEFLRKRGAKVYRVCLPEDCNGP
jgi:hypothetical protein